MTKAEEYLNKAKEKYAEGERYRKLAGRIVEAVVRAVDIPVTVKFRAGWDSEHINAVEFAKICEDAGAAALTVHGRTRMQMFAPPVDLDIIRRVKETVSIPVIGNGDIDSPEAAKRMYDETGCDLVMVGRAAMGNPWIFRRIEHYMQSRRPVFLESSLDTDISAI